VTSEIRHSISAIIPCNDLNAAQAFYERLGFNATSIYLHQGYRILHDSRGATIHLTQTEPGWVFPERNAYGLYFYAENVELLAVEMGVEVEKKPWGLLEFAVSDPSGTLVRVGWPYES
jgi:catechol 2,3-dioxygenase-like lactoylglutathione lyase family enzyme